MLEEKIDILTKATDKLREAVEKNNALLAGGKGATTAAAAPTGTGVKNKDKAEPPKSKYKATDLSAMAARVQKEVSTAVAKELIKATGAADLNDLVTNKVDKWEAFMDAAEAKLAPDETETEPDPDAL